MVQYKGLLKPFSKHLSAYYLGLNPVSLDTHAELHKYHYKGGREDSSYFLATDSQLLIQFGITGLPTAIWKYASEDKEVKPILVRQPKKNSDQKSVYYLYRENLPANGVIDNESYDDVQVGAQLLDYALNKVKSLEDDKADYELEKFKHLTASQAISRFNMFLDRVDDSSIIPDFTDTYVPVFSTMEGCPNKCNYCPIAGKIRLYTLDEITEEINWARDTLHEFHDGDMIRNHINDLFVNGSDYLWHALLPRGVDPRKITALQAEAFPEVTKRGAFFGTGTVNKVVERHGIEYLEDIATNALAINPEHRGSDYGVNRAYKGDETGHDLGSRLLNKNETFENKVKAAKSLKDAGMALKQIIQVGVFGEGFYKSDEDIGKPRTKENFVTWQEHLDRTIDLVIASAPYRVMISRFLPLPDLPIQQHFDSGRIVQYENPDEGIQREKDYIIRKLRAAHKKGLVEWQGQSDSKPDEPPIEDDYDEFVVGATVRN